MILVPCMQCYTVIRVLGDREEISSLVGPRSEFWPSKFTCVHCEAACEGILETEAEPGALAKMKVRDLSAHEFFVALHGNGLPDEIQCDAATVQELFQTKRVKKLQAQDIRGTTRCVLEFVEFEDGTKVFLGSSAPGAVVYRITRPISYAKKVLDGS